MSNKIFSFMHRNDPVCAVTIDMETGAIVQVSKPVSPELLPLGGNIDAATLRKWWQRRAVPMGQGKIKHILAQLGISSAQEYLVKNLGLSLSDHYWIKPLDLDLNWEAVNLFTNDFRDPVGEMQMNDPAAPEGAGFSPSSSTQGDLSKKWIIINQKRCLVKGNHGSHSQESLNETVATLLHQKQGLQPYVAYSILKTGDQLSCMCESFTSDEIEFIPAIDVVNSQKKDNATSVYEHFIQICQNHGLAEYRIRAFLEYQILTDFILTNTDRHLNNFGVLRKTDTLEFVSMAPIFDSGNSMFWQNPRLPEHDDLTNIPVNSFRQTEMQLLHYVKNPSPLDLNLLPQPEDLKKLYEQDQMVPHIDSILTGYQRKIHLLDSSKF